MFLDYVFKFIARRHARSRADESEEGQIIAKRLQELGPPAPTEDLNQVETTAKDSDPPSHSRASAAKG